MGFFQSLKDDLSEAVNELMEEENAAALKKDEEPEMIGGEDIDINEMLKNIEDEMSGFVEETVKEEEKKSAPSSVDEAEEAVMAALMAEMASLDKKTVEEPAEEEEPGTAEETLETEETEEKDADAEADELLKMLDDIAPAKEAETEKKVPVQKSIEEMLRDIQQQEAEMAAMMGTAKPEEPEAEPEEAAEDMTAEAEEVTEAVEAEEETAEEEAAVEEAETEEEIEQAEEPEEEIMPEPVAAEEPAAEAEPVQEEEPVAEAEPVQEEEPAAEPEAVAEPEPEPVAEPVAEAPKKRRAPARSRVASGKASEPVRKERTSLKDVTASGSKKGMEGLEQRPVTDETAMISEGMTIKGNIHADGNMDVYGIIEGNVDIAGKMNIAGILNGDVVASEVYADGAEINGDVRSFGSVKVGQSTVIIGDVFASSAVIAGAVKGDIDVKGPVILDSAAIVMGNIRSQSVQISNGAVVEGMCSQVYAEVSPASFFEEYKKSSRSAKIG